MPTTATALSKVTADLLPKHMCQHIAPHLAREQPTSPLRPQVLFLVALSLLLKSALVEALPLYKVITRSVHYKTWTQNYFSTFTENTFRCKGPPHDLTVQSQPQRKALL